MSVPSLEDLWTACGGTGQLRLLVDPGGKSAKGNVFATPFVIVGSMDSCDLVMKGPEISRRHAYFQIIAGRLWCTDLESRAGVCWGGRTKAGGWVNPSEGVQLGPHLVRTFPGDLLAAEAEEHDSRPITALPWDEDTLPSATLEFLTVRPESGTPPIWRLDRILTFVGQARVCKVRFASSSISRFHCSLLRTPLGVWMFDLVSRGGTLVNGESTRWALLKDGDCLRVGDFDIGIRTVRREPQCDLVTRSLDPAGLPASGVGPLVPLTRPRRFATSSFRTSSGPAEDQVGNAPLPVLFPSSGPLSAASGALAPAANQELLAVTSVQSVLQSFVNQFTFMHQQMFEQFQDSTLMMMQMIFSLHKDQLELVKKELDEIRELNREINALHGELAKSRSLPPGFSQAMMAPSFNLTPGPTTNTTPSPAQTNGVTLVPTLEEINDTTAAPNANQLPAEKKANQEALRMAQSRAQIPTGTAPATSSGVAEEQTAPTTTDAQAEATGPEVHDWLCQRFTELQEARQSRWQRVLSKLLGK